MSMFLGAKLRNLKWFEARALTQLSQTCCAPFCVCYLEKGELSFLDLTSSIPLEVLFRPLLLLIVASLCCDHSPLARNRNALIRNTAFECFCSKAKCSKQTCKQTAMNRESDMQG